MAKLLVLCSLQLLLFGLSRAQNPMDDNCFDSEFRIRDINTVTEDFGNGDLGELIFGVFEICVNETYTTVCNSTGVDAFNLARIACDYMGYQG